MTVDEMAKIIEDTIDALPMERRLYPDTYAAIVAEAIAERSK